ncbi:galactose oxidase [Amylocystis lapponica]|nr:galactose oxidase [Amylocystis lapponica]
MSVARWSLRSKAPWVARSSHCVSASQNGTIVVYGGELKPRTPVDALIDSRKEGVIRGSVHLFSLGTTDTPVIPRKWNTVRPTSSTTPEPRVGATIIHDGRFLYLWGGRGGVDMAPLDREEAGVWRGELTNASTNGQGIIWTRLPVVNKDDGPEPRSYHTAVAHAGKIYIHAGCPASGRLNTLHSFDLTNHTWKALASAPDPVRGGTSLAVSILEKQGAMLLRYGGFSGYELPSSAGSLDIYSVQADKWYTVQPATDPVHGNPGPRSVHGFTAFQSTSLSLKDVIAVLFHGERDATGTFWEDVWLLAKDREQAFTEGWAWRRVQVVAQVGSENDASPVLPEGRGWFASTVWVDDSAKTRIAMHGGLLSSNERSDELWELEIE